MRDWYEIEEQAINDAYHRGELTNKEYMNELTDLRRAVQADIEDGALEAMRQEHYNHQS